MRRGADASTSGRGARFDGSRLLLRRLRKHLREDAAARILLGLLLPVFLPLTLCFTAWALLAPVLPKFAESLGGGAGSVGVITSSRSVRTSRLSRPPQIWPHLGDRSAFWHGAESGRILPLKIWHALFTDRSDVQYNPFGGLCQSVRVRPRGHTHCSARVLLVLQT